MEAKYRVYTSQYSCEESPMADHPSFEAAVALLGKAVPNREFRMALVNQPQAPVEAVIVEQPDVQGWYPEVWLYDADEADGGWYVVFNRILSAQESHWRFRMGSKDGSRDEYLMHLQWYTDDHPELQNFTVIERDTDV